MIGGDRQRARRGQAAERTGVDLADGAVLVGERDADRRVGGGGGPPLAGCARINCAPGGSSVYSATLRQVPGVAQAVAPAGASSIVCQRVSPLAATVSACSPADSAPAGTAIRASLSATVGAARRRPSRLTRSLARPRPRTISSAAPSPSAAVHGKLSVVAPRSVR